VLALDEAQKIPRWSETAKRLWDEDARAIKSQIDEPMVCRVFPEGKDSKGDLYEFMLGKIASAGNGQFRTPRHIIRLIASSGGCHVPYDEPDLQSVPRQSDRSAEPSGPGLRSDSVRSVGS